MQRFFKAYDMNFIVFKFSYAVYVWRNSMCHSFTYARSLLAAQTLSFFNIDRKKKQQKHILN